MVLDPAIQLLLDDMKKEYVIELPSKVERLRAAWQDLAKHPTKDVQQAYHRLIHDLHGSAGTFGFEEISEAAAACETAWLVLAKTDTNPTATPQLETLTESLCTVMNEVYSRTLG